MGSILSQKEPSDKPGTVQSDESSNQRATRGTAVHRWHSVDIRHRKRTAPCVLRRWACSRGVTARDVVEGCSTTNSPALVWADVCQCQGTVGRSRTVWWQAVRIRRFGWRDLSGPRGRTYLGEQIRERWPGATYGARGDDRAFPCAFPGRCRAATALTLNRIERGAHSTTLRRTLI